MMPILTIAVKDLRLLIRDPRSAVILFLMPLVMILVLGLALGDVFSQKPDDRIRISVLVLDEGLAGSLATAGPCAFIEVVRRGTGGSHGYRQHPRRTHSHTRSGGKAGVTRRALRHRHLRTRIQRPCPPLFVRR